MSLTLAIGSLSAGIVPREIQTFMPAGAWASFHAELMAIKQDGCQKACMVEWGLCICCGVFCLFCCHPCISNSMADSGAYARLI